MVTFVKNAPIFQVSKNLQENGFCDSYLSFNLREPL
jgi:hypothetical protein